MTRPTTMLLLFIFLTSSVSAAILRVPQEHKTIQAAIDVAERGDTVLVSPGRYTERIRLKPGVLVRSAGDQSKGKAGLKRAEVTILDGSGEQGHQPGVTMADDSKLDGFTITNVGVYDNALWQKHFESQGEELGDDEGSAQAEGSIPAISIRCRNCNVVNNIVHHNGDVGIAVIGSKDNHNMALVADNVSYRNLGGGIGVADFSSAVIRNNTCYENLRAGIGCRNSSPFIIDNTCYKNLRAGVGCREGASPIIRGNQCFQNRRAGIGIRMKGTAPVVERNECFENHMAGIGNRDGAKPIIRDNKCYRNTMAGIGSEGSLPIIVGNDCRENQMAGIGMRGKTIAIIHDNQCIENQLVAIGVTEKSKAIISGNLLERTGGVPPIIAIKDGSTASIQDNTLKGGGVAAVLVHGSATIIQNDFQGRGDRQGNAVWVWEGSTTVVTGNSFNKYGSAVNASKAKVAATDNTIKNFQSPAIVVKNSSAPAHVFGNLAISNQENAEVVQIEGPSGIVAENVIRTDEELDRKK